MKVRVEIDLLMDMAKIRKKLFLVLFDEHSVSLCSCCDFSKAVTLANNFNGNLEARL